MLKESRWGYDEWRVNFESGPQSLRELTRGSGFVCDIEPALLCSPEHGLLRLPHGQSCCAVLTAGTAR